MAGEIVFTPTSYSFGKIQLTATKPTTKIIITNKSSEDILLNSLVLPEGFTYEFIDEFKAYQPYDFHSIYQDGFTYTYDDNGQNKNITYKGFKNIYNLKDPIVCCKDINNTSCCDKLRRKENASYASTNEFNNTTSTNLLLKAYIPYGTFDFSITLKTTDDSKTIAISRLGKPPDNYYENDQTGLTDNLYTSAKNDYYEISNLVSNDSISVPSQKLLKIAKLNFATDSKDIETYTGKWLYVIVRTTGTIEYTEIASQFLLSKFDTVDTTKFREDGDPQYDSFTTIDTDVKNPTEYVTITYPYYRAPENIISYKEYTISSFYVFITKIEYSSTNANHDNDDVNQPQLRIFMPPGTFITYVHHITRAFDSTAIRFNEIPSTYFQYYSKEDFYKKTTSPQTFEEVISEATGKDKWNGRGGNDNLEPVGNISGVLTPGIKPEKSGWIYEKLNCYDDCIFIAENGNHNNNHLTKVFIDEYNQWWDHGGSNTDGSINWNRDVESVTTYKSNGYAKVAKLGVSSKGITSYKTIHNRYHRIPDNLGSAPLFLHPTSSTGGTGQWELYAKSEEITSFFFCPVIDYVEAKSSITMVRMFIPPGTIKINFRCAVYSGKDLKAIIRHNQLPTTNFNTQNDYKKGYKYNLYELTANDCCSGLDLDCDSLYSDDCDKIEICYNDFGSNPLPTQSAGWLYVNVNEKSHFLFQLEVYKYTYNAWWDKGGSKSDGSIDWDVDIEPVTSYISKI